jgi:hypothetical protein
MIARLHAIHHLASGKKRFLTLILNTSNDGDLTIDAVAEEQPHRDVISIHLPPDSAAALRNVLLDKLPIRRTMTDLLALSDPID